MKLNGKKISERIINNLKKKPTPKKFLAVFVMKSDKRSFGFVNKKKEIAKELGVDFRVYEFDEEITNDGAREQVLKIAKHKTCGGVVVQLPLREGLNKHYVVNVIPREKDVDVLGERALGAFYNGRNFILPPSVAVVSQILCEAYNVPREEMDGVLKNKTAAVVGRGFLTGKPIAVWLLGKTRETIVLGRGSNLEFLKKADLVISGVGKPKFFGPELLKKGAGVIDFGYGKISKQEQSPFLGDLDVSKEKELEKLAFYTPTPGGTGPILVAKLFENFYVLAKDK